MIDLWDSFCSINMFCTCVDPRVGGDRGDHRQNVEKVGFFINLRGGYPQLHINSVG